MDKDSKEIFYQIFLIGGLIFLSLVIMYFSYKQSRNFYYDSNGNPKKEMQEMFKHKDVARVPQT